MSGHVAGVVWWWEEEWLSGLTGSMTGALMDDGWESRFSANSMMERKREKEDWMTTW